jgi:hypothetical protein
MHTGDAGATPITFRLLLFIIKGLGKFSSFAKRNLRELEAEKWKRRTKRGGKCAKNRINNLKFRRERKCCYGKSPYTVHKNSKCWQISVLFSIASLEAVFRDRELVDPDLFDRSGSGFSPPVPDPGQGLRSHESKLYVFKKSCEILCHSCSCQIKHSVYARNIFV